MDHLPDGVEAAVILTTYDSTLEEDLRAALPDTEIVASNNAIGGSDLVAFVRLSRELLTSVLGFVSKNRARIGSVKMHAGDIRIDLNNYTVEDLEKLLASPGFKNVLRQMRSR